MLKYCLATRRHCLTSIFLALVMGCTFGVCAAHAGTPHEYQGYADTKGGEGGKRIEVTNLNDSGPGSFRQACNDAAAGKCIIVFKVGGTIYPKTTIQLKGSNITVDGATAPAPGITLDGSKIDNEDDYKGAGPIVGMALKNAIVRHMRFRNTIYLNLHLGISDNVVLDHVSSTACSDGALFINPSTRITLSYCIFAGNAMGLRVRGDRMSIHHCLFAENGQRSPFIQNTSGVWDYRNNVVQNWGRYAISFYKGCRINIINNHFGPSTLNRTGKETIMLRDRECQIYTEGNTGPTSTELPNLATAKKPYEPLPRVTTQKAEEARKLVLAEAGALPRDEIDQSYVDGTRKRVEGREIRVPEWWKERAAKQKAARQKKSTEGPKEKKQESPESPSKSPPGK